jgi:hypothetical protein
VSGCRGAGGCGGCRHGDAATVRYLAVSIEHDLFLERGEIESF